VGLLEGAKGHHRAIQPDKQFDGDLVRRLQVPYQFKMVARGAAGILQGKDLMVIEDAHESYMLPGEPISHQNLSQPGRVRSSTRHSPAPYNDLSAMKFTLAIPSVRLPQVPTVSYAPEIPKVRIPFLSLLLEPRPLKKWLLIWLLCLYLAFCWGCYFGWEQPRLNHDNYVRFGADSPTYWDAVKYRSEHAENDNLVSFSGNLLGPVLIGTVFRNGIGVALFNIFLFFVAIEVACTIPGVDRYRLVFLLAVCSETAPALVTLNKEILVLFSTLLLAKYIYSERRSWLLLGVVLAVSLFARWEQVALIFLFLFLRRKGSIFERSPKLAIGVVIGVLTVLYALIARLPGSGLAAFTQYTAKGNTIAKLVRIQADFGFPLVLAPKILMNLFGELLRPLTFVREYSLLGWGDIHSIFIIPLFSISLCILLVIAYRRGKLDPHRPIAFLIIIYAITTAITPFVQPRYNYFAYVLLALELARNENLDEENGTLKRSAKGAPGVAALNQPPEGSRF
jgi:hypothetical protein